MSEVTLDSMIASARQQWAYSATINHPHAARHKAELACLTAARDRIAELQRQVEAARGEEREACAKVCDARAATLNAALAGESRNDICVLGEAIAAEQLAAAIRARGKA